MIYYDKFFQRVRANLPKEVTSTAERLFARCYEYRDEIRDELECVLSLLLYGPPAAVACVRACDSNGVCSLFTCAMQIEPRVRCGCWYATATLYVLYCMRVTGELTLVLVHPTGRWVVGMEDWNSKMEKRLQQISELVLLANSYDPMSLFVPMRLSPSGTNCSMCTLCVACWWSTP